MKSGLMRRVVLASLLLILVLTTTSAYIRLSQAGLGCADWPACYGGTLRLPQAGQLLPGQSSLFWAHALHRLSASSAGVLLLLIVFMGWGSLQGTGARLAAVATLSLAVFLACLGLITPSDMPAVMLGNLLGGMSMAALLWWLYRHGRISDASANGALLGFAFALLALQIALGGMVGARQALLACTTLPVCGGNWWPESVDWTLFNPFVATSGSGTASAALEALSMAHRFGALLVAAVLCVLGIKAIRRGHDAAGWLLLGTLGLQLVLGAGMVLANFPLPLVLMHNLCAVLLLVATANLVSHGSTTKEEA